MHINYLKLHNFRNYHHCAFLFSPGVNVIWGNNGEGKTNLLEAIQLLSTGRSPRTHRLQEMIREGADSFAIEAHFIKEGVSHTLKVTFDGQVRKIVYNDTPHTL